MLESMLYSQRVAGSALLLHAIVNHPPRWASRTRCGKPSLCRLLTGPNDKTAGRRPVYPHDQCRGTIRETIAGSALLLHDARREQRRRLFGSPSGDVWGGEVAAEFRFDPHRELDANLAILASYLRPEDVLVDVGGGAGRVSLPMALRCRQVLTVEPSPGMAAEYSALAEAAGVSNARLLPMDWMASDGVEGDVAVTCDVTYFIRDIVPFIQRMVSAARRRVMITVWSEPPPDRGAGLFRRVKV